MTPSLAELKEKITGIVARQEAAAAAVTEGKEKLAQLKEGKGGKSGSIAWSVMQQVSRRETQGLDNETVRAVFMADAARFRHLPGCPIPRAAIP